MGIFSENYAIRRIRGEQFDIEILRNLKKHLQLHCQWNLLRKFRSIYNFFIKEHLQRPTRKGFLYRESYPEGHRRTTKQFQRRRRPNMGPGCSETENVDNDFVFGGSTAWTPEWQGWYNLWLAGICTKLYTSTIALGGYSNDVCEKVQYGKLSARII